MTIFRVALCRFGSPRTRRPASPLLSEKRAHPAIKSCWYRHVSKATTGLFAVDGPGVALRTAIAAAGGDAAPIVTKRYADAFQGTDLAVYLAGTVDLLVCGMMTQNCVVFTALSRAADGFRVQVVGDLCSAPTETVHKIALNALRSKTRVVDAADIWVLNQRFDRRCFNEVQTPARRCHLFFAMVAHRLDTC